MGLLGTIAGGIGGFLLGGPAGAIAGAGVGSQVDAARSSSKAATRASRAEERAAREAIGEQRRQFDITQENLEPFIETGQRANTALENVLLGGDTGVVTNNPLFNMAAEESAERVNREASATGLLGSGARLEGLRDTTFQAADTVLQRLMQLSGRGQQGAGTQGQFGQRTASNIGNLMGQAGTARASGFLGRNAAFQQGIQGVGTQLGSILEQNQPSSNLSPIDISSLPSYR